MSLAIGSDVLAQVRMLSLERGDHVLHALYENPIATLAKLPREAVASPVRGSAAENVVQAGMLVHEPHRTPSSGHSCCTACG